MWTGIAVAVITAVYAVFAGLQWQALRDANATAQKALEVSERVWRDTRRAFLEFEKPDFDGPVVVHIKGPYKEPTQWSLNLLNRGIIGSPEYVIQRGCVAAFAKEPTAMPCKNGPTTYRPLGPGASESITPEWIDGEPTPEIFEEVALGIQDIYVFAVIGYDDGLGGKWERPGCWRYTKRNDVGVVISEDFHRILRCRLWNTPERRLH